MDIIIIVFTYTNQEQVVRYMLDVNHLRFLLPGNHSYRFCDSSLTYSLVSFSAHKIANCAFMEAKLTAFVRQIHSFPLVFESYKPKRSV